MTNRTTRTSDALAQALRSAIMACLAEDQVGGLPRGTPLMASTGQASEIFGVSKGSLYRLRKRYPDFRALTIKTGREVLFDVPRCYEWFRQFGGAELDIAE